MNSKTLVISKPTATVQDGWYRLSAAINVENGEPLPEIQKDVWFALPEKYADEFVLPDCSDCFLLGLLYFAMRLGYDIRLEGAVSKQLVYNLKNEIMPIMNAYRPCVKPIGITVETMKDFQGGQGVATGFSGGIDSFATVVNNIRGNVYDDNDALTHLFFFNVGTHGLVNSFEALERVRKKFLKRYETLKPAAQSIGLPFISIDSNLNTFLPDTVIAEVALCNSAVVHFLRKGLRKYLLSSAGYNYKELFRYIKESSVESHLDIDVISPMLCQWLGDGTLRIMPSCTNMTRIEKTLSISEFGPAKEWLNVCNSDKTMEKNCSICWKCRGTITDLEILGKLDNFRSVFDVDLYREKYKSRDIAEIIYSPTEEESIYLNSSRRYAIEHGIDLKSQSKTMDLVCAYLHQTWLYVALKKLNLLKIVKGIFGRKSE